MSDPLEGLARRLRTTSARLWTVLVTALVAVVLLVAVAPAVLHPRPDPPAGRDPFAGLVRSDR